MFGISWAELLVVILVTILIVPSENWPDIAKFLAKCVRFVRQLIWKISDASENIKEQIELEKPINDLIKTTTDDVLSSFSSIRKPVKNKIVKKKITNKSKKVPKK